MLIRHLHLQWCIDLHLPFLPNDLLSKLSFCSWSIYLSIHGKQVSYILLPPLQWKSTPKSYLLITAAIKPLLHVSGTQGSPNQSLKLWLVILPSTQLPSIMTTLRSNLKLSVRKIFVKRILIGGYEKFNEVSLKKLLYKHWQWL